MKPVLHIKIAVGEGEVFVRHRKGRMGLDLVPCSVSWCCESVSAGYSTKSAHDSTFLCADLRVWVCSLIPTEERVWGANGLQSA